MRNSNNLDYLTIARAILNCHIGKPVWRKIHSQFKYKSHLKHYYWVIVYKFALQNYGANYL